MLYELHYYGGLFDGQVVLSPRPYDAIEEIDGSLYSADVEGEECLEWAGDDMRIIRLHHRPGETL